MPSFLSSRRYLFFNSSMSRIHSVYCVPFFSPMYVGYDVFPKAFNSDRLNGTDCSPKSATIAVRSRRRISCNLRIFIFFFTFKFVVVRYIHPIYHSMFLSLRIICETACFFRRKIDHRVRKLCLFQSWTQPQFFSNLPTFALLSY